MVYLPIFTIKINQNVGKYTIHGCYGLYTRVSMEVIVTIVSKLVYFTYLGDVSNLLIKGCNNPFTKYHGHPNKRHLHLKKTNSRPM